MARRKKKRSEEALIEIGVAVLTSLMLSHIKEYAVKRTHRAFDRSKNKKDFIDYEEVKQ